MSRRFRGLRQDPEVLCHTVVPTGQGAGTYTPSPISTSGSLTATPSGDFTDSSTIAEVVQQGLYVPQVVANGGIQSYPVHDVFPVVDSQPNYSNYLSQRGTQTELMAIPRGYGTDPLVPFGLDLISSILTILQAQTNGTPVPSIWLLNTTPKCAASVVPSVVVNAAELAALPGAPTTIPTSFVVDEYGFQYIPAVLASILQDLGYTAYGQETGGIVTLPGSKPGTTVSFQMPLLDLSTPAAIVANWPLLSGGLGQTGNAKIYPLWRWATNANATAAGTPFVPRYQSAQNPNVAEAIQNLYFDFSTLTPTGQTQEAFLLNGMGVKSTAANNLQNTYLATPSRGQGQNGGQIPTWGQLTLDTDNPMNFGEPEDSTSPDYDNIPDFNATTIAAEVAYPTSVNVPGDTSAAGSIFWGVRGTYATTGSANKYLGG